MDTVLLLLSALTCLTVLSLWAEIVRRRARYSRSLSTRIQETLRAYLAREEPLVADDPPMRVDGPSRKTEQVEERHGAAC
jgi:hypothetical protein